MKISIRNRSISSLKLVIDSDKLKFVKLYRIKIPEQFNYVLLQFEISQNSNMQFENLKNSY